MKKRFYFLSTFLLLLSFFYSCNFYNPEGIRTSSIVINFGSSEHSRAVASIKDDLSYFVVSIEPKVQEDVKVDFSKGETKAEFGYLNAGFYKIQVSGFKADNTKIAYGESEQVEVKAGKTAAVSITMKRLSAEVNNTSSSGDGDTTSKPVIPEGFVKVMGTTIKGTENWEPASNVFVSGRKLTIPDLIACDHEVTRGEFVSVMGEDNTKEFMDDLTGFLTNVYDKDGNKVTGDDLLNLPMGRVNWYHAITYCNKLSLKEGLTPCYSVVGIDDWGYVKFDEIPGYSSPQDAESDESLAIWDAATCDFTANGYRLPTEA